MNVYDYQSYLARLEQEARDRATEDVYLWPRTPLGNIQAEIWARTGHSDWNGNEGRAALINRTLHRMIIEGLLREDFAFLDICCGDGLIPWQVQRRFPFAQCHGVDINKGKLETHGFIQRQGVQLWRIPIQYLFASNAVGRFDVICMLNTYRGWGKADLRPDEADLPGLADEWFKAHARYIIVTTHDKQRQMAAGFWVKEIGPGEDDSTLVLMWPVGA